MRTKKLFFSVLALAGMLFANSCTQEDVVGGASGDFVSATFTLSTADGLATRAAIGDGTTVDEVACAVYDANGNELEDLRRYVKVEGKTATYSIRLAKGLNYRVAFFAYNKAAAAYDVDDLKNIVVNPDQLSNLESRDAFTGYYDVKKGETMNTITTTVYLRRPFAQLNLGIDATELKAAADAGAVVKESYIKVSNVYNAFSAYDNAVVATDAAEEMEFAMNTIPAEPLTVGDATYTYLARNYLLVGDENAEKSLTDVSFVWEDENGVKNDPAISFINIPVQRNYRTNITGRLLTSPADFTITIDAAFVGEHPGESEKTALEMAASVGGKYTLTEDIVLDNTLNITNDLILDLNGNTITAAFNDGAVINNGKNLTIVGGTIENTATNGAAVITNSGKLVLKDVAITGAPIGTEGYPSYAVVTSGGELTVEEGTTISSDRGAVHMSNGANVTINGGIFDVTDAVGSRTLTSHVIYASGSSSKLTINGGNFAQNIANGGGTSVICPAGATIKVYGGNFYHVPVSDVQSGCFQNYMGYGAPVDVYGGTYNDNTVTKSGNLAEGYKAVEKDGKWYVVAGDVNAIVSNDTELKAAFAAGSTTVLMKAGTYDTKNFQVVGKTINLKGIEEGVRIYNSQNIDVASTSFDMCTVTFENLTIETLGGNYKGFARMNGTYKNCTIVNNYFTCYGKHLFENCTFNAPALTGSFKNEHCVWTYGAEEVDFVDCTFNYSDRCVNVYVDNGGNAPGITSDVAFTNCVFNTENAGSEGAVEVNSTPFTAGVKVVLENCKAPAHGKMVYVSPWDGTKGKNATITVDDVVVAGLSSVLANAPKGSTIVLAEDVNLGEVTVGELKNVTIKGDGTNVMIFKTDANTKIENVTIKNVKFEYTGATADCGVVLNENAQIDNLVIENSTFVGTGAKAGRGLSGKNANASIEIKNCTFKDMGYPVYAWGGYEALTIEDCTFENIKSWAIMPQSGFDGDLTVTGCTFKDCLGGGLVKAGTLTAGHTFTFTNNTITGCTVAGDHNWFQFNVSAGTSVISGNTKDGAAWTPGAKEGLE